MTGDAIGIGKSPPPPPPSESWRSKLNRTALRVNVTKIGVCTTLAKCCEVNPKTAVLHIQASSGEKRDEPYGGVSLYNTTLFSFNDSGLQNPWQVYSSVPQQQRTGDLLIIGPRRICKLWIMGTVGYVFRRDAHNVLSRLVLRLVTSIRTSFFEQT